MKNLLLLFAVFCLSTTTHAQNIDSIIAAPQTIELSISTPQPRLNETFEITLDASHIRANIFRTLFGKLDFADGMENMDNHFLKMKVKALRKGKNEIGPLAFTIDKTSYTSNAIHYEVVAALPDTDKGLWIRKVMTSDTSFCLIIDQRIPAEMKRTDNTDHSISFTTEAETDEVTEFKYTSPVNGAQYSNSRSESGYSSLGKYGEGRQFKHSFSIYYYRITDRNAKIRITRDMFKNLPKDYKFEEIVVQ